MTSGRRVAVLGADGQLGRALVQRFRQEGSWSVEPTTLNDLDLTNADALTRWVQEKTPDVLINCAALTNLDRCEQVPEMAERVNGTAVATLAHLCNSVEALLVQMGTDYVFDGSLRRPYREEDPVHPLNAYARSKWIGEQNALRSHRHLVVRTAWLHGAGGVNFLSKIVARAKAGQPLRVVNDQTGSPSFAIDVAEGIFRLIKAQARGVVHVVNAGRATWFELATHALQKSGIKASLEPVSTDELASAVLRPGFSVLDTARYTEITGHRLAPWNEALEVFMGS